MPALLEVFYHHAKEELRIERVMPRCFLLVCGFTVGAVAMWDLAREVQRWCKDAGQATLIGTATADSSRRALDSASAPPDLLARSLVRKNSRLSVHEAYSFGRELGDGSFGVVYRAVDRRTGIERAIKQIRKLGLKDSMLACEVQALQRTDHPNICQLVEYFETEDDLWLVMELCSGEDLLQNLIAMAGAGLRVPEVEAAGLLEQMLRATLHCHRQAFLHRDLKPENFVLRGRRASATGDSLKLIDFGYAAPILETDASSSSSSSLPWSAAISKARAGTLLYMSPEMFLKRAPSKSDDVWSLGVILHILLSSRFPFSTNVDSELEELCAEGRLEDEVQGCLKQLSSSCSPAAVDLARKMLDFNPGKRITIEAALEHPFLAGCRAGTRGSPRDLQCAIRTTLSAEEVLQCCERFLNAGGLWRVAAQALARLADDCEEKDRARATFLALDLMGAGQVAVGDLQEHLRLHGVAAPGASWFSGLAGAALSSQGNATGGVAYTTFMAAMLSGSELLGNAKLCRAVFDLLDADHDGLISAEDLSVRLGLSIEECSHVLLEAMSEIGAWSLEEATGIELPAFQKLLLRPREAEVQASASDS